MGGKAWAIISWFETAQERLLTMRREYVAAT
jgi:hypothetical protein